MSLSFFTTKSIKKCKQEKSSGIFQRTSATNIAANIFTDFLFFSAFLCYLLIFSWPLYAFTYITICTHLCVNAYISFIF